MAGHDSRSEVEWWRWNRSIWNMTLSDLYVNRSFLSAKCLRYGILNTIHQFLTFYHLGVKKVRDTNYALGMGQFASRSLFTVIFTMYEFKVHCSPILVISNICTIQAWHKSGSSESEWSNYWIKSKNDTKMGDHLGSIHFFFLSVWL